MDKKLYTGEDKNVIPATRFSPGLRGPDPIHHFPLPPVVLIPLLFPEPQLPPPPELHLRTQRREERHKNNVCCAWFIDPLHERRPSRPFGRLEIPEQPVLGAVLLDEGVLRVRRALE